MTNAEETPPAKAGQPRRVGVRDVAKRAGVSLGTVSNVLNNPDRVVTRTRSKVERAMRELDFVPSRAAGQLRSRKSDLVGVLVPDVGNPFWAAMIRGIEKIADSAGLSLMVASSHQDPDRQARLLRVMNAQGVDGLIIAPVEHRPDDWAPLGETRYGVVVVDGESEAENGAWVTLDNVDGARMAMQHLLEQGHRRIALINGPLRVSWCAERREGAHRAVTESGLQSKDVLVEYPVADLTVQEGSDAIERVLEDPDITAVMCVNDMLALGCLRVLRERGISVPSDLALVGYDDAEFAAALNPPLTTVRQPSYEMGATVAELLFRAPDREPGEHIEFVPVLVVRGSSVAAQA